MKVFLLSTNLLLLANVEDRLFAWRNWPWKPRVEWLVKARCDLGYPLACSWREQKLLETIWNGAARRAEVLCRLSVPGICMQNFLLL